MNTERKLFVASLLLSMTSAEVVAQGFEMPPSTVVVEEARVDFLAPSVDVPGTVISRNDARLASELAAKLEWIAEVGTTVAEGDTLARLENITFRINEMEAESRVTREKARVTFLQSERGRLEQLAESNLSARSQLDRTISDLAVAESDQAIAEAQLNHAKVAMHVTEIRAPFDGVVTTVPNWTCTTTFGAAPARYERSFLSAILNRTCSRFDSMSIRPCGPSARVCACPCRQPNRRKC
jgi:multidrug efflux pump subunit AcrA (membrane-fusion protein)